jgi:hypothetical protein
VWFPQPAPRDHPWRTMAYAHGGGNAMVPHMSGTTLDAQARYAKGVKDILERYFTGKPQNPSDVIVENGSYATKYTSSYLAKLIISGHTDNASKCRYSRCLNWYFCSTNSQLSLSLRSSKTFGITKNS